MNIRVVVWARPDLGGVGAFEATWTGVVGASIDLIAIG